MTTNEDRGRAGGTDLRPFERNRFFHGKLMTARDMQAEQDYHAGRLNALSGLVVGEGIVRGLEVAAVDDAGDGVEVTVEPGVALDGTGRPIVIEHAVTERLPAPSRDEIHLFVAYDEASKDRVPVPGADHASEEDCTYNRVLETYEVYYRTDPPEHPKSVPAVELPTGGDGDGDDGAALTELARTYHRTHLSAAGPASDPDVFLGSFERQSGAWVEADGTARRPYVYTNDMLYAALVRHATDVGNPHEVSAEGVSDEVLDAIDRLESVDEFVGRLDDLEARLDRVETQKAALERYVMSETVEAKIGAFEHVNAEFGSGTADEIVERSRNRLREAAVTDRADYLAFVDTVLEWETALEHELEGEAADEDLERYSAALAELKATREGLGDGDDLVPLAAAQRQVCTAAGALTRG